MRSELQRAAIVVAGLQTGSVSSSLGRRSFSPTLNADIHRASAPKECRLSGAIGTRTLFDHPPSSETRPSRLLVLNSMLRTEVQMILHVSLEKAEDGWI